MHLLQPLRARLQRQCASLRWLSNVVGESSCGAGAQCFQSTHYPHQQRGVSRSTGIQPPPHPQWKLGDGLPESERQWKEDVDKSPRKVWDLAVAARDSGTGVPAKLKETYKLLTSAIVPRPIAFVSSLSQDGIPNLAPFSYFSMVGHHPPVISISINLSARIKTKDTRENILGTKEFTVNIISEPFVEAANSTSIEAPAEVDEWLLSGLTPEPSISVKPPIVKESAVSMECELYHSMDITPPGSDLVTTTVVLGLIKQVHVRESVLGEDGAMVDAAKLRPVSRLGGLSYACLGDGFDLPRIEWKERKGGTRN